MLDAWLLLSTVAAVPGCLLSLQALFANLDDIVYAALENKAQCLQPRPMCLQMLKPQLQCLHRHQRMRHRLLQKLLLQRPDVVQSGAAHLFHISLPSATEQYAGHICTTSYVNICIRLIDHSIRIKVCTDVVTDLYWRMACCCVLLYCRYQHKPES